MLDRADDLLKLALAVAALALGLGVGYYYAVFLPQEATEAATRFQRREERQQQAEAAKAKREAELGERTAALAEKARIDYDVCISNAFTNYQSRWQKSCQRLNATDVEKKERCFQQGYGEQYCSTISLTPARGCFLPSDLANSYDSDHLNAQKLCLSEFETAKPAAT